eukprot:485942-Prymnesium_polylepis.1
MTAPHRHPAGRARRQPPPRCRPHCHRPARRRGRRGIRTRPPSRSPGVRLEGASPSPQKPCCHPRACTVRPRPPSCPRFGGARRSAARMRTRTHTT